jgi:peptidoglycan/xylan/chitin deacetylase (PgdA/CDA1 family)
MTLRRALRFAAHHSGLLPLLHRRQHAATLSAVMLHRVLPTDGDVWPEADPGYTLSAQLFTDCLRFFRRHYSVVGLHDVLASIDGGPPLPPCAMLITFDDGWRDNVTHAWPILRREGLPAVVFIASDAVTDPSPDWWQDTLLRGLRQGHASYQDLWQAVAGDDPQPDVASSDRLARLLLRYGVLDRVTRQRILAALVPARRNSQRDMIEPAQLSPISADGLAVGSHGASHLPLSLLPDPASDLRRSRQALAATLGETYVGARAMSFPHGRYDRRSVAAAVAAGFDIQLCSVPCVNDAPGGRPASRLLGRIEVPARQIVGENGELAPDRLATWLFNRPVRRLAEDVTQ